MIHFALSKMRNFHQDLESESHLTFYVFQIKKKVSLKQRGNNFID